MGAAAYRSWVIPSVLCVVLHGCQEDALPDVPDAETGFPHAAYHDSCSPVDGPAQVLALTQDEVFEPYGWTGPRLTIDVYRPPFLSEPALHQGEGATDDLGAAARCGADGSCELADRFSLRVDSISPDRRVAGYLRVEFADGEVIAGPFTASRIDAQALCG